MPIMAAEHRNYYADLQITQYATTSQIKSAFHTLAKQHHPDKSGNDDASTFRRVREAYETLSDPTAKAAYDRTYHHTRTQHHTDNAEEAPYRSRTAAYEAEQEARELRQDPVPAPPIRYSPPPLKPVRKPNEPSWAYYMGKSYTAWEKRDAAWRQRHPEVETQR